MKKLEKLSTVFFAFTFICALASFAGAQGPEQGMTTFFDSDVPGIRIQVNATARTRPSQNITVMLGLRTETDVHIQHFNLSIYGFANGTDKILMENVADSNLLLNGESESYNRTFTVREDVWDATYGEMTLTYNVTYKAGGIVIIIPYENLVVGFTMTHVENVYLKNVEEQLSTLRSIHELLNRTFWESFQMNLTAENLGQLNQTYWTYRASIDGLDTVRNVAVVLGITTIFFVASTVYMIMRKPQQSW